MSVEQFFPVFLVGAMILLYLNGKLLEYRQRRHKH
jgi:hypothetical protein